MDKKSKFFLLPLNTSFFLLPSLLSVQAVTTIDSTNHHAFAANLGWMDWRGDTANGAVIGEFICSGNIYAANVGWISLGSGTPANGIQYQNNSGSDYGVNHDGLGNLRGFAYGANIGWVNFENTGAAQVDLKTGNFTGYAYSANCGWISLSNAFAWVQTDSIAPGADTDGDGIPDAWEYTYFGNLTTANATSNTDGDAQTDLQEYKADTNPTSGSSTMQITDTHSNFNGTTNTITWTSVATRCYRIEESTLPDPASAWVDTGLGLIRATGATTTRTVVESSAQTRFYRVVAVRPLGP